MFCNAEYPDKFYPRLKGKAAETRNLARPLLEVWRLHMDRTSMQHKQIELALDYSGRMEEIVDGHSGTPRLPRAAREELLEKGFLFLQLFNALADHYSRLAPAKRLFNMTIKAHYLAHTILQSQWLNPKLGWCYSGEDFMQHTRRLMHRCTVGNTAERAGVKFASLYRIGLHCILQRST